MQVESSATPMLTVDEANGDTTRAFEETDAAVDFRIKNSICLFIDLEGFFVQKKFQVREIGYYSWNEYFGRHAFFQPEALFFGRHFGEGSVTHEIYSRDFERDDCGRNMSKEEPATRQDLIRAEILPSHVLPPSALE